MFIFLSPSLFKSAYPIGGDLWIDGKERKSGVYPGTNATVSGQERLHPNTNYQQESQPKILRRKRHKCK